jgi:23S rRNA pseudouridine1911/1915/1917 synthase
VTTPESFEVGDDGAGKRLDVWIASAAGLSRGEAQSLIERGLVTLEGAPAPKSRKLAAGETVQLQRVTRDEAENTTAPFAVAYEDEHLAVIVKPPGVVVHPAPGTRSGTLVEALGVRMPLAPAAGPGRPGIVHRLDKETSGLMVVAKTDRAYEGLVAAMSGREVSRTYLALVAGTFALPEGRIEAPVGRSPRERTKMGVVSGGREAVTEFKVLESFGSSTLIEVHLGTGRTHQIRVHLAHIHRPVVGDAVYGKSANALARQLGLKRPFLHSHRLQFVHPVTGADIDIVDPLPPDLATVLGALERAR